MFIEKYDKYTTKQLQYYRNRTQTPSEYVIKTKSPWQPHHKQQAIKTEEADRNKRLTGSRKAGLKV